MKVFTWRNAAVAIVLITSTGQALAGGRGHWGGDRGRWSDRGHYHRGSSNGAWIGGAALLGVGALLAWSASRPDTSTSIQVGSGGYYGPSYGYGNYYGPAVTYSPPPVYVQPAYNQPTYDNQAAYNSQAVTHYSSNDVVAYPANGQDGAQQSRDREACRSWAMNQSGFDPSYVTTYTTSANTESYQRALGACYKGRGYSIN